VVAKLDANESPFPLAPDAVVELGAALGEVPLHRYGDDTSGALRDVLAASHGVSPQQIAFGHGSYELIGMLVAVFGRPREGSSRGKVLYPSPTFFGYGAAAVLHGAEPVAVPLGHDLALDVPALDRAIATARPNLAFFCRPNNPTGTLFERDTLADLSARHRDVLFVVDEVYQAYAGESLVDLVAARPNLAILRSLSKVGGAALRVGYAIADAAVIAALERVRPPFTVNALSGAAATWLLTRGAAHSVRAVDAVVAERRRIEAALRETPGLFVFPSHANFVLVRCGVPGDGRAADLWQRLRTRGVLVGNFDARGPLAGCLRVTIGAPRENDLFLAALAAEWDFDPGHPSAGRSH
jgi:histidinol-phosphate aminotransferase